MRINNNISAMNTYSRLNSANTAKSGSLAKLSSGLRINRAGDDAAGLSISEKMRGQIGGLKQATRNAQDGISLIQTAEGGLNETHSILNRMRELAVQSSNDTNTFDDRIEIQKEINELSTEITRIGNNTEFNTQNLLGGNFSATFQIGANQGQNIKLDISDMKAESLDVAKEVTFESATEINIGKDAADDPVVYTFANDIEIDGKIVKGYYAAGITTGSTDAEKVAGLGLIADAAFADDAAFKAAGISSAGIHVMSQTTADAAITSIDDAINKVSAERSKLGATQNRLEHTINNLSTTAENLAEAESRIRDVDMAEEMMEFTKNNILSQAATSMLAQANQMPQSVLQLLQ